MKDIEVIEAIDQKYRTNPQKALNALNKHNYLIPSKVFGDQLGKASGLLTYWNNNYVYNHKHGSIGLAKQDDEIISAIKRQAKGSQSKWYTLSVDFEAHDYELSKPSREDIDMVCMSMENDLR